MGIALYVVADVLVTVAGYTLEVGVFYELKYWKETVSTESFEVIVYVFDAP